MTTGRINQVTTFHEDMIFTINEDGFHMFWSSLHNYDYSITTHSSVLHKGILTIAGSQSNHLVTVLTYLKCINSCYFKQDLNDLQ